MTVCKTFQLAVFYSFAGLLFGLSLCSPCSHGAVRRGKRPTFSRTSVGVIPATLDSDQDRDKGGEPLLLPLPGLSASEDMPPLVVGAEEGPFPTGHGEAFVHRSRPPPAV